MVDGKPVVGSEFISKAKALKPHLFGVADTTTLPDARALSAADFDRAVRALGRSTARKRSGWMMELAEVRDSNQPGTQTGTTAVTKRAPTPSAGSMSGNALEMSDREFDAALKSLR